MPPALNLNVTFSPGSSFDVELNGLPQGAANGYDRLNVTGTVNLGNATLSTTLGFNPSAGQTFTIIDNEGADPIVGIFNGLPQGAIVIIGGRRFQINYRGGTGNDVELTCLP